MKPVDAKTRWAWRAGLLALAAGALAGCGGGGSTNTTPTAGTLDGTVAIGAPLAGATVTAVCRSGTASATTDSNGHYSMSFVFDPPCGLTAAGSTASLQSVALGSGTYNLTSLTQLVVQYIASQLGLSTSALLSGVTSNAAVQSALATSTALTNAEKAVAGLVSSQYHVTLSSTSFVTTAFVPGQSSLDSDLDALRSAGAITSSGAPATALVDAVASAGAAAGGGSPGSPTGGTGGSGTSTP
jgi:hypothetical protein